MTGDNDDTETVMRRLIRSRLISPTEAAYAFSAQRECNQTGITNHIGLKSKTHAAIVAVSESGGGSDHQEKIFKTYTHVGFTFSGHNSYAYELDEFMNAKCIEWNFKYGTQLSISD